MIFMDVLNTPLRMEVPDEDYLITPGSILLIADGSPFTWSVTVEDQIKYKNPDTTVMYDTI